MDLLRGAESPQDVKEPIWLEITSKIKRVAYSEAIQINCYILAATRQEFDELKSEPNLQQVLTHLNLNFAKVANWYGVDRNVWRPAGGATIKAVISTLELTLAQILTETGVPKRFENSNIVTSIEPIGLWSSDDQTVKEEIIRLKGLDFCWIFIDPLSLYHQNVQKVATRIGTCAGQNKWLNIFLIDPIGRILDRTDLRTKLQNDFSNVYERIVKPRLLDSASCLGGVDVWHADDFERVFRETMRLHRLINTKQEQESVPEKALASLTPK